MFLPQDIIAKKRDGHSLTKKEIQFFIDGVVSGNFTDYQSSALLMAIFFQGMQTDETKYLTEIMMNSGTIMDLSSIPGPKADKHSTGGVGDKVSLILSPLAAACDVNVPMMSGRGLGHTGGTLDKLESIPGFNVNLSEDEYKNALKSIGCSMIGQTSNFVPADKKLYALRDVTATVESIPLICASIMSKKLAEGIDSLVLDVKVGNGAFMKNMDDAKQLAQMMVATGKGMGKPTIALLTDMNQPLGLTVGNSLEVIESIQCLQGKGPKDLMDITLELTSWMVYLSKKEKTLEESRIRVQKALTSGHALSKLSELISIQGGDPKVIEDFSILPTASSVREFRVDDQFLSQRGSQSDGFIHEVHALKVGKASLVLGAGRSSMDSVIDHAVGISAITKVGTPVKKGDLLCKIHYNDESLLPAALDYLNKAFTIKQEKPEAGTQIYQTIQ